MMAVIAIIVAAAALVLNIIQWHRRHRPYIGVVALEWETVREEHWVNDTAIPDTVKCTLKNVGETPAKAIKFHWEVRVRSGEEARELDLGILFPGQQMEGLLPFDVDSDNLASDFLAGYGGARVCCRIDYRGVLPRQHYFTKQHFSITNCPTRWLALPDGECS